MATPDSETTPEPTTPSGESPAPAPLVAPAKKGGSRALTAVLVAIIIVLAAALAFVELYHPAPAPAPLGSLGIQAASVTGTAGQPMEFTIQGIPSGSSARVYLGDGTVRQTSNTTMPYTYTTPGTYLVYLDELDANGVKIADTAGSLLKIYVLPDPAVVSALAADVSPPTIAFNTTQNPNAPIGSTSTPMAFYGGYGEISAFSAAAPTSVFDPTTQLNITTSSATTVSSYTWNFGDGHSSLIYADPSTSLPVTNPVQEQYASSGVYAVQLTMTTNDTTTVSVFNNATGQYSNTSYTGATHSFTVAYDVAIGSNFKIGGYKGTVPSPGVITELVNSPGGPYSFDPQIDYETTGFEVVVNTAATLLIYNGSSTTSWIPYVASEIPSVANGEVSADYTNYTFHIRSNMGFSNGDPITAYDVYYTMIRAMLFQGGSPGTADWIISQYLVPAQYFVAFEPIMTAASGSAAQAEFNAINNSISYDNTAGTVTFHLAKATAPTLFFTAICDALGTGIMDAAWLQSVGAGITFTPAGFFAYQDQANEGSYNFLAQVQPVTSGPFEVNTYVPGQSVVLTPNPYFPGVPEITKQNKTVIIDWVADPSVAYQLFASGQGDIATILPPNYFPQIKNALVPNGATIEGPFSTINEFFNVFNNNISLANIGKIGSGYSIPADYFANLWVRQAFAYAFNYTLFVDRELGNAIYGFNFGSPYCGVIVPGVPYSTTNLTGCPTYDLTQAKALLVQSGNYSTPVTFPFVVPSGDTTDFNMGQAWAAALNSIDPNINMQPVYQTFHDIIAYQSNGSDPMPVFNLGWIADYPYPSDYVDAMYKVGGTYPQSLGWYSSYFTGLAAKTSNATLAAMYNGEAQNYSLLNQLISAADLATNPTSAAQLYQQAEQVAVKLYMYVYTFQQNQFWIVKPYMTPHNNVWGYQENPTIGAGADSFYAWWNKG